MSPLLTVENLHVDFGVGPSALHAVRGVSFAVNRGETLGIVGESGSGKSVTALSILRLIGAPGRIVDGRIDFDGLDLLKIPEKALRDIRGSRIAMVFQDPLTSLNPTLTIGDQIVETILEHRGTHPASFLGTPPETGGGGAGGGREGTHPRRLAKGKGGTHPASSLGPPRTGMMGFAPGPPEAGGGGGRRRGISKAEAWAEAENLLRQVHMTLPERRLRQYPFELSGGMRQRAMIAMAFSCRPELLIADEPTTALDVTVQAQILDLMDELRRDYGTSVVLITHDLGVVSERCDHVAVMYGGQIVEYAPTRDLFDTPLHPYTQALLASLPDWRRPRTVDPLPALPGQPPALTSATTGCPFAPRCPQAMESCSTTTPPVVDLDGGRRYARCLRVGE